MSSVSKNEKINSPLLKLIGLLLIKAFILALIIIFYTLQLAPDEAQYWTWSRHLDWGYYSKPPGIAWQIWFTTFLFGSSPFGIRLGALVLSFFLALTVYLLARRAGFKEKIAFWAGVVMAFSPLGVYLSVAATTDVGAILFLTLAVSEVVKKPNYPLAGVWILFGALYKWVAFAFWPICLLFFFFYREMRRWNILWGIVISLFALVPSLYWNIDHDWATFKHVGGALGESRGGNFFDFLGAQIGLLSPVFFILLFMSYFYLYREKSRSLYLCGAFPFVVLIYLGGALFTKMQPNWAAYLYPPGMVLIAWVGRVHVKRFWLHVGTWLSIGLVTLGLTVPWLQSHGVPIPYKSNPFRQSMGWEKIPQILIQAGYNPQKDFLFADKYQAASLLSFYGPGKKRAYFFNVSHSRKNQFTYWPQMETEEAGKTGYFVVFENTTSKALPWYENHYLGRLAPYFKEVTYVGSTPLFFVEGIPVKYAIVFKGTDYLGTAPPTPEAY